MKASANLAIAAAALFAGVPASAQLAPSAPADIAAAGVDCWQAVSANPVDEAALRSKGWEQGKFSLGSKRIEPDIRIYGKRGTGALLMISMKADPKGCLVMSSAKSAADVSASIPLLLQGLKTADPKVELKKVSAQEVGFFSLPKAALFRLTGDPAKPGVMIQVSHTAPETK